MAPPERQRKTEVAFRSAKFSGVMLFRSCAARGLRAGDVSSAVGDVRNAIGHAVACSPGKSPGTRTGASRF